MVFVTRSEGGVSQDSELGVTTLYFAISLIPLWLSL